MCPPECNSEMPSPDSKYNIAKDDELFNSAWTHGLYDLMEFGAGFCYTYDPPDKSKNGVSEGLYFMLGHKDLFKDYSVSHNSDSNRYTSRDSSYLLLSFDVFLHEKVINYVMKLRFP